MAQSYANQIGTITISTAGLDRIIEIPLGFQPVGITAQPTEGGDRIAIAAYYEPAICLADVTRDETWLHFAVSWVRDVNHGIQSVRLFPDFFRNEPNRLQSVNFGSEGTLWINRNEDRDFFVLAPPAQSGGRWTLLARHSPPRIDQMIHSTLLIEGDKLITIESPLNLEGWMLHRYQLTDRGLVEDEEARRGLLYDWNYGIGRQIGDQRLWFVTDFRITHYHPNVPPGIYLTGKLVVPDVFGNGICFLSDGSALVTRYGQGHQSPFNGVPGALIYVPASFFIP